MTGFEWAGRSADPNDEQFGDVVEPATLDDADAYDVVLLGEPYDGGVIGRHGARGGPRAIREALAGVKTHHFDAGPVGTRGAIGDVGDVKPPDAGVRAVQDAVAETTATVHATDVFPVFVGGDNSLTFANARPLLDGGAEVGAINLDAHLDVREVRGDPSSGTPYRQLVEAGLDAYACVGARHFETSTDYHDYVRNRDGTVVTAEEVGADPVTAADLALDAMAGVDRIYLSVDCDVLDASAAPGVSAPTPGGLTTRELYRLVRLLAADPRVVGFEVVECAPRLDENGRTVDAAALTIAHAVAAVMARG